MDAQERQETEARLAAAERELDEFERQPPLGARAYLRGRNARRQVVSDLREELEA